MAKAQLSKLDISIKESVKQIEKKILIATRNKLNVDFAASTGRIQDITQKHIFNGITSQPEYESLANGSLRVELGLVDGAHRIINILDLWLRTMEVKFKKFRLSGGGLTGGITIEAIKSDYSDVLRTDLANFTTEKGEILPWLKWMLLSGGSVIIANYNVRFKPGIGRTGGGAMRFGGTWSMPSQFVGVIGDNFVTRGIESIWPILQKDIVRIIESKL